MAEIQRLDRNRIFHEIGIDQGVDGNEELRLIEVNTDVAPASPFSPPSRQKGLPPASSKRYQQRNIGMFQLFMDWLNDESGEEA